MHFGFPPIIISIITIIIIVIIIIIISVYFHFLSLNIRATTNERTRARTHTLTSTQTLFLHRTLHSSIDSFIHPSIHSFIQPNTGLCFSFLLVNGSMAHHRRRLRSASVSRVTYEQYSFVVRDFSSHTIDRTPNRLTPTSTSSSVSLLQRTPVERRSNDRSLRRLRLSLSRPYGENSTLVTVFYHGSTSHMRL